MRLVILLLSGLLLSTPVAAQQNGIEARVGKALISVVALREDVLHIRIGPDGTLPPDESWAALPDPRHAFVAVRPTSKSSFETKTLIVKLDPQSGALAVEDKSGRPILTGLDGWRQDGDGFRVDLKLGAETHIFGLGDKMGPLDRRGRLFSLWNSDAYRFQESTDPLYKSIPFFLALDQGRAYGLFLDNSWRSVFDFGASHPDELSFGADNGPIDYYLFTGPDPKAVLQAYGWLTGTPPLPPLWAFGFQQSRYGYENEQVVREVAERLRRDKIPADVIWFDINALDGNRAFTTDEARFPDFPKLVADLDAMGLKSVIITDLHLAEELGYPPYDSGMAGDHFLKTEDGALYLGKVWPGLSVFPDFSRAETRKWWGGLYSDFYDGMGIAGFWNDMNEPAVFETPGHTMPPEVRHRIEDPAFKSRIATHAEMHNVYGMLNSRATYEGLLALQPDRRPFVMTRASFAGGQRYAVTWTGDNSASWNHLRLSTPQLLSLGLSGFAFAGDDLGGFTGTPSPDLLTQWIELGMYNPIARDHSEPESARQEVWAQGPEQEDLRRRAIEGRYRRMPYIYALAEEAARTGIPMMRPLFLEFPTPVKGQPLDLLAPNEFMWGEALLVAPSPWPESPQPYKLILPPGDWFDEASGKKLVEAPILTPTAGVLPVFVRAGSILPSQPLVQSTAETPQGPLTLDIYPGPTCHGSLYADDGASLAYKRGAYFRQRLTCASDQPGEWHLDIAAPEGAFTPWWRSFRVRLHGDQEVTETIVADPGKSQRIPLLSALSKQ
jgi:alpha-glucosidase